MLASAGLHAFWNWLVAEARDSHAIAAVALLCGAVAFAPVAVLTWDVEGSAWPYVVASGLLHLTYFAVLAAAYERADLSFVYPIARGMGPVLVLVVSLAALGADLSVAEVAGVIAIAAGVLLVRGVGRGAARRGLGFALAVAGCIAAYTLVDDEGVRHAAALSYFEAALLITAPCYAAAVALARGPGALRAAATPRAAAAGVAMFAAYALTLAALELAEAAPVAALRETSVVMATAAAALAARRGGGVPGGAASAADEREAGRAAGGAASGGSGRRLAGAVVVVLGIALIAV